MIKIEIETVIKETMELHPVVSTFPMRTGEFINKRRAGNSTRQINAAIEYLFQGFLVQIRDHFQDGKNRKANEHLFKKVLERLDAEHGVDKLILTERLNIDFNKLEIELL